MKTSFLNTGQLALAYLRYIVAGGIAGVWTKFGRLGALLTNLASTMELSIVQNMETASCFERVQSVAWPHLARERGILQTIKGELVKINRDRLHQCVNDQISEFPDRRKTRREKGNYPGSNRNRARNRKKGRSNRRGAERDQEPNRRRNRRSLSPRYRKESKSSKYTSPAAKKEDGQKDELRRAKKDIGLCVSVLFLSFSFVLEIPNSLPPAKVPCRPRRYILKNISEVCDAG